MKKVRFHLSVLVGKIVKLLLKILHKKIPYYPGYIAYKICPDFLDQVKKPELIIAVTGTNGKSTISGLLVDAFKNLGYTVMNNNGFNVKSGVISMFLNDMKILKKRSNVMIMEIDEVSSYEVFKSIKPQFLICTNLFRDSMKTNSNTEYIAGFISKGIPAETKVIMTSDDLLAVSLINPQNPVYYTLKSNLKSSHNVICDFVYCPSCGGKLKYDYIHYHHIGHVHCEVCGYTNPASKYVTSFDLGKREIRINDEIYQVSSKSIFNIYNILSVITLLKELNFKKEEIEKAIKDVKIINSRYSKEVIKDITLENIMAKGQNPVACSSVFDYVRKEPGRKNVILILDDVFDRKYSVETVAWYYDTDFEFLIDPSIKHIYVGGIRAKDIEVRLLLAGIPKENITLVPDEFDIYKKMNYENIDSIYILHDILECDQSEIIKKQIKEEILCAK